MVQKITKILTIQRSSYYNSLKETGSDHEQANQKLTAETHRILSCLGYHAPQAIEEQIGKTA